MENRIQFLPSSRVSSLEENLLGQLQTAVAIAEKEGSIFPTAEEVENKDYDGVKFSKKYYDIFILIMITWYTNYFKGFEGYVRYEIQQYLYRNRIFPDLAACLVSKEILFDVIAVFSNIQTTNKLFSVLNTRNITRVLSKVSLRFIHYRRPIYPQFRRGYRDHGSLRRPTTWLPSEDILFDEEQRKKEKLEQDYLDLVSYIVRVSGDRIIKTYVKNERRILNEFTGTETENRKSN